jgi:HAMP domain-containing protein
MTEPLSAVTSAILIAAGLVAALTVLLKAAGWMLRTIRRLGDFLDDWNGEPARPGVPRRPGHLERLGNVESSVRRIEEQMHNNGGSSLRDQVDLIAEAVTPPPEV